MNENLSNQLEKCFESIRTRLNNIASEARGATFTIDIDPDRVLLSTQVDFSNDVFL